MAKNQILAVVLIALVVAIVASVITVGITGNVTGVCSSKTATIFEGKSFVFYDSTGTIPYKTSLSYIDATSVKLNINGELIKSLSAGGTWKIDESASITVNKIYYSTKVGAKNYVSVTFKYCPITPQTVTYQGVLDMLNKCELTTGQTSANYTSGNSCDQKCSSLNKVCTLTIINLNIDGDLHSKLQTCSLNFREQYPNQYYSCTCCSV